MRMKHGNQEFIFDFLLSKNRCQQSVKSSTGLQNQYTGDSYNLSGGAPPNVSHGVHSPFHLIDFSPWRMTRAVEYLSNGNHAKFQGRSTSSSGL